MNAFLIEQFPNRISLAQAASLTGYHQDYLGQLCRLGKLKAAKIGRNWYTTKSELQLLLASPEPETEFAEEPIGPTMSESMAAILGNGVYTDADYTEAELPVRQSETAPMRIDNVLVSSVRGLPITLESVEEQRVPAHTVHTLVARLRLDRLQKEVLTLSDTIQDIAQKVERHEQLLQEHVGPQATRPDLRSLYAPALSFGPTPHQRKELIEIADEEEVLPRSWILQAGSWVAPLVILLVLIGGGVWWLWSNPFTGTEPVSTIYYRQTTATPQPQVAGDTVLSEPDMSGLQSTQTNNEVQSRISGVPLGEELQ